MEPKEFNMDGWTLAEVMAWAYKQGRQSAAKKIEQKEPAVNEDAGFWGFCDCCGHTHAFCECSDEEL